VVDIEQPLDQEEQNVSPFPFWRGNRRRGEGADALALLKPARESWAAARRRRGEEEERSPRMAAAVSEQRAARALELASCLPTPPLSVVRGLA